MKRLSLLFVMVLVTTTAFMSTARAEGNANFILGLRLLDEEFWQPVDDQLSIGVNVDWGSVGDPIRLAAGLHYSEDKEIGPGPGLFGFLSTVTEAKGSILEVSFGIEKIWINRRSSVRPYIGGGLAWVNADYEVVRTGIRASDSSAGYYVHGGIFWATRPHGPEVSFNYGFELRMVGGTDIDLGGLSADADYLQLGFLFGLGW
jgi:hypothetical protein